jgi:hypothetical protein
MYWEIKALLHFLDDLDEILSPVIKVRFGSQPQILNGKSVINFSSCCLIRNWTRIIFFHVPHHHDLPLLSILGYSSILRTSFQVKSFIIKPLDDNIIIILDELDCFLQLLHSWEGDYVIYHLLILLLLFSDVALATFHELKISWWLILIRDIILLSCA